MIHLIKRFVDWLDSRFPPRFYVTEAIFRGLLRHDTEISQSVMTHAGRLAHLEERISALEKTLNAIKDFLAKGAVTGKAAEQRRADFIASGRMAE